MELELERILTNERLVYLIVALCYFSLSAILAFIFQYLEDNIFKKTK